MFNEGLLLMPDFTYVGAIPSFVLYFDCRGCQISLMQAPFGAIPLSNTLQPVLITMNIRHL